VAGLEVHLSNGVIVFSQLLANLFGPISFHFNCAVELMYLLYCDEHPKFFRALKMH